jgi:hypothetical protein
MSIELLEGQCIALDAHLSDLLDIYTRARNGWTRQKLQAPYVGEEERPEPAEVTSEQMARELLLLALTERLERWEDWL